MDITQSSLWNEVESIVGAGDKPVHVNWEVKILANDETILPFKVLSVEFDRNYLQNYTDFALLDVMIPLGTFVKKVYPYLSNLDIEVTRRFIGETNDGEDADNPAQIEVYSATMIDKGNPIIEASLGNATEEEELNRMDIPRLQFQLMNKSLEQIRLLPVGGIYRNMTGEDVVKAVLTKYSQMAKVPEDRKLKGVDMVKASNQKKREQIIIPQGIQLVDLPHHIHYHCGGLYATGLGYYMQGDHWYVYPCYDNTRFNDGNPTLTVINVPETRLPGIERTYRKDGDNLVVLATGKSSFRDLANVAQLNDGNGMRFADASKMVDSFVQVDGNKAVASRAKNNTEVITTERDNRLNFVTTALRKINANPFVEYSEMASRQGSGVNLVWENANSSLLYPGMPVKVMYLDGDDIKEAFGVLLGAHEYSALREPGYTGTRYTTMVTLSVFIKPLDEGNGGS